MRPSQHLKYKTNCLLLLPITVTDRLDTKVSCKCTCYKETDLYSTRHLTPSQPTASNILQSILHGKHFLMVANRFYNKRNSVYVLYRWETGTFKEIQRITPFNGFQNSMHFFTINTRNFMSFANYGSNQVSIYEWKNETFGNKTQNISINVLPSAARLLLNPSRTLHVAAPFNQVQPRF